MQERVADLFSLLGVHVATYSCICRTAECSIYMVDENQTATKNLLSSTIVNVCIRNRCSYYSLIKAEYYMSFLHGRFLWRCQTQPPCKLILLVPLCMLAVGIHCCGLRVKLVQRLETKNQLCCMIVNICIKLLPYQS